MEDELLIKFLLKESNADENKTVADWLAKMPQNQVYFEQLQKIWVESKQLSRKSERDVNEAWDKFKASAIKYEQPTKIKSDHLPTWIRFAAVFVVAIGSWGLYSLFNSRGYTAIQVNTHVISQVLPDGSALTLNKFSHIKYATNFKNNRSIYLDSGDVFFEVTKNKEKPFVIEVDKVKVEVVGTSFNVKHLNKQTEVVVETGIVKVSLGKEEILLKKGEKIILTKGSVKLHKLLVNDQLYNYYRSKLFIANNTPLPQLIAILNEAYRSKIKIDDSVKQLTITTTLQYEKSLNDNLHIILESFDNLKIKRNRNEIILSY